MVDMAESTAVPSVADAGGTKSLSVALCVAAAVPPITYFVWVWHYAVNAPYTQDDWSQSTVVSHALHGGLSLQDLWAQYSDARYVLLRLVYVGFGFVDHLNLRAVILTSALIFIATYALILVMFRTYLNRTPSALSVLTVGVVWFSLGDTQNALWAFQLAWYLALFFSISMLFFFFVWPRNQHLSLALAVLAGIGASLSMTQGLVVWPLGVICVLWRMRLRVRRKLVEVAVWVVVGVTAVAFYLRDYRNIGCQTCTAAYAVKHPALDGRFLVTLIGNVVPTGSASATVNTYCHQPIMVACNGGTQLAWKQLLGVGILVVAVAVIVHGVWKREPRFPLPLLLVTFALLFDAMIVAGRVGEGTLGALVDRYLMPNVVLVVGIVIAAFASLPARNRHHRLEWAALGVFVAGLTVSGATFGTHYAQLMGTAKNVDTRTAVNLSRIPPPHRICYVTHYIFFDHLLAPSSPYFLESYLSSARKAHLMMFADGESRPYRVEGLPPLPPGCRK